MEDEKEEMSNAVVIVSLGPGDPELITLKGLNRLRRADRIFCPATLASDGTIVSRTQKILNEAGIPETNIRLFPVAMDTDRYAAMYDYADVVRNIEKEYEAGHHVVITAEGDAGFYSSSSCISDMLTVRGIPIERIAGVPAFIACAAAENIRISERDEEASIITRLSSAEELIGYIKAGRTVVLMKVSRFEALVKEALQDAPDNVSFHYFENTGIPEKAYYTHRINDILSRRFPYFSLLIIRTERTQKA